MVVVSTGSQQLDSDLLRDFSGKPLGGVPKGRLVEIAGRPSSGVSTLCWSLAARSGSVCWVDCASCGLPLAAQELWNEEVILCTLPTGNSYYLQDVLRELVPHVDCFVIDPWEAAAYSLADKGISKMVGALAQAAMENDTLVLVGNRMWGNARSRGEFSKNAEAFRTFASLGLFLPKAGECQVAYSRLGPAGRSVLYVYSDGLCGTSGQGPLAQ